MEFGGMTRGSNPDQNPTLRARRLAAEHISAAVTRCTARRASGPAFAASSVSIMSAVAVATAWAHWGYSLRPLYGWRCRSHRSPSISFRTSASACVASSSLPTSTNSLQARSRASYQHRVPDERVAVGADSLFVPGLVNPAAIAELAAGPLPVTVMVWPGAPPVAELAAAGAVRISLGSGIAQAAYAVAVRAATELLTSGTYNSVAGGIAYDTMNNAVTAAP